MINFSFVEKYKDKTPPWGPIGYITYKRTYARMTDEGVTEEWWQTVYRCLKSLIVDLEGYFTQEEIETLYDYIFNLKISLSGRALWQLGTNTVRKVGADSLQNCWNVAVREPIKPFTFTFNQLMLGGGVGFNIKPEMVYELPKIKYSPNIERVEGNDVSFIVPDNREGWVELLRKILEAFYYTGSDLTYATHCIRDRGAKISGFGGIASGPEELVKGIEEICNILTLRHNQKLRPIDCLDIQNILGSVVVAGNVRRSAEIAVGDASDLDFITAKMFGKKFVPRWRSMSNNSVDVSHTRELPAQFWNTWFERDYDDNAVSESIGLVNIFNSKRFGRLADGQDYRPDYGVCGFNPCAEITLESYEACNLAEIYLPNVTPDEFMKAAALLYKVTKTISCYPFSDSVINEVVQRNHRLGIGVTGYLQSRYVGDMNTFYNVYRHIEELDKEYSKQLGVSKSIKLTTVKPSGTLSLLPGVSPGVHPGFAPYYIRRVRFASDDKLVDICRQHGYPVEYEINMDGSVNYGTYVVSFPVKLPKETLCAKDVNAVQQLKHQKFLQTNWSDNAVSVTVYFKDEELPAIRAELDATFADSVKSVSVTRHSKHGFLQAPMEEITEDQYLDMSSGVEPITKVIEHELKEMLDSSECSKGNCPIK